MNNRRKEQIVRQTVRLAKLARQIEGFLDANQCLIGLAKKPKCPGAVAKTRNARVLRVAERIGAMTLRIVQRQRGLKVLPGEIKLPEMHECDLHGDPGVRESIRQPQEFSGDLTRGP